jgi:hypothetical protein
VDDLNPPSSHKFEKGNTSLKQPFLYIGNFLPKSDFENFENNKLSGFNCQKSENIVVNS